MRERFSAVNEQLIENIQCISRKLEVKEIDHEQTIEKNSEEDNNNQTVEPEFKKKKKKANSPWSEDTDGTF